MTISLVVSHARKQQQTLTDGRWWVLHPSNDSVLAYCDTEEEADRTVRAFDECLQLKADLEWAEQGRRADLRKLRDEFAGRAMAAFIGLESDTSDAELAHGAYHMADAMLKARGEK